MKATIKTIAEVAGVSVATVSMVLNKKDNRISDVTRQKILAIAKKLNYQPNVIARSLVTATTKTIGLLIPDVSNPFFAEIAKHIESELSKCQYNVFLCNSNNDRQKEQTYLYELASRNIDGLILASVNLEEVSTQQALQALKTPVVVLDRCSDDDLNAVSIDNRSGGGIAAQEFLRQGHRKAMCFCGSLEYKNIRERVAGFTEVWNEIAYIGPDLVFPGEMTVASGYERACQLMELIRQREITALFCTNDLIAFGAYKAFKEAGLSIPDDISLIGFDNIEFAEYLVPSLTTIEQPVAAIGKRAATVLLNLVGHKITEKGNYVFPVNLIRRNSVKNLHTL